jgi:hypothetical protein
MTDNRPPRPATAPPTPPPASGNQPGDKLNMGLTADAEVRHVNSQLPTHDETIRINALSLAISAQARLLDIDREELLQTAERFETWIRRDA